MTLPSSRYTAQARAETTGKAGEEARLIATHRHEQPDKPAQQREEDRHREGHQMRPEFFADFGTACHHKVLWYNI
jgi:hypothetical protein